MKINLRINDYFITIDKGLDEAELKKHSFKKAGFFDQLFIKLNKDEIVWWAKNCSLKYFDDNFQNSIHPILDHKAGTDQMFGTSAYLWFKENKLTKITFQIIQNKMIAEIALKQLEEKLFEFIGNPILTERPLTIWEIGSEKLILEYPQRMHGYIHMMNKNL